MVVYIQFHMSSHVKLCARVRKMCFFFRMWCILQIQTHIWKYSTTFCFFPENRATQHTHANPHMKVLHHLAHSLWVPIIYFRVACESFILNKEHIYVCTVTQLQLNGIWLIPPPRCLLFFFEIVYIYCMFLWVRKSVVNLCSKYFIYIDAHIQPVFKMYSL